VHYPHLRESEATKTTDGATLEVDSVAMRLAGTESTEVITGTGPGKSTEDRVPLAIFRRVAQKTTFVWAIALDGKQPAVDYQENAGVVTVNAGGQEITVDTANTSVRIQR
jgi:hypothetical protein